MNSSRCDWASAIASECLATADDSNFPVPFARVVLFYAARMARKLSAPPATVLQLLRSANELGDAKDSLGPCDIDLPTTWLVLYQFKFLSALAFSRAGSNTLPHAHADDEEIMTLGLQLSDELDKCRKIGMRPFLERLLFLNHILRETNPHLRSHQAVHRVSCALFACGC
jgi:hypothetical protein